MMFGDRAPRYRSTGATGHGTIRGESFLWGMGGGGCGGEGRAFGDARLAGWMSLSHKSRAVSSGAVVRSSCRSSCRALITPGRLTRASAPILSPGPLFLLQPSTAWPFPPATVVVLGAYLSSFSRDRPSLASPGSCETAPTARHDSTLRYKS